MREFNDFEKKIIERIVTAKIKLDFSNLSLATILDEELETYAIEWENGSVGKPSLTLVYNSSLIGEKLVAQLLDIIFLLKYLEDNGLLLFHISTNCLDDNFLYNRSKYRRDGISGQYWLESNESNEEKTVKAESYILQSRIPVCTDIALLVPRYAKSLVHPSPILDDLVKHNFKSVEQRRFEEQRKYTRISIGVAIGIGIIGIVLNIIALCKNTNINKEQIESIQTKIQENKVTIPETINITITNDTLKVNVINPQPTTK